MNAQAGEVFGQSIDRLPLTSARHICPRQRAAHRLERCAPARAVRLRHGESAVCRKALPKRGAARRHGSRLRRFLKHWRSRLRDVLVRESRALHHRRERGDSGDASPAASGERTRPACWRTTLPPLRTTHRPATACDAKDTRPPLTLRPTCCPPAMAKNSRPARCQRGG